MSFNVGELVDMLKDYPDDMEVMLLGWERHDTIDSRAEDRHKEIYEVYETTIDYQDIDDETRSKLVNKQQDVVLIV